MVVEEMLSQAALANCKQCKMVMSFFMAATFNFYTLSSVTSHDTRLSIILLYEH